MLAFITLLYDCLFMTLFQLLSPVKGKKVRLTDLNKDTYKNNK